MPTPTVEQLEKRETTIKQKIAAQGESTEGAERRAMGKALRRVQRKRRRMLAVAERRAAKPKAAEKPPAEKPAEPPADKPAEESPPAAEPEAKKDE